MSKRWTQADIDQLREKNIRVVNTPVKNIPINIPKPKPKALIWLEWNLQYWANERAVELKREYRFDRDRKWRFDFAFESLKIAVEYEGIFTTGKSRHTTVMGYHGDTEKYNRAAVLGWRVIRVTAKNARGVIGQLDEIVNKACHE